MSTKIPFSPTNAIIPLEMGVKCYLGVKVYVLICLYVYLHILYSYMPSGD